jgi:hypothetical protein
MIVMMKTTMIDPQAVSRLAKCRANRDGQRTFAARFFDNRVYGSSDENGDALNSLNKTVYKKFPFQHPSFYIL